MNDSLEFSNNVNNTPPRVTGRYFEVLCQFENHTNYQMVSPN